MPPQLDNHELTWYMQEISMHGFGAHIDFTGLTKLLSDPQSQQSRLVWFHLTSFLSHAAMISKYLSPSRESPITLARKEALRNGLQIDIAAEILPRDARNNVEHFDERIDNWIVAGNPTILEIVLQNRAGYDFIRAHEKRIRRVLIQEELVFVSEKNDGSKFELSLQPLHSEVERISSNADQWIREHSPYHFIYPRTR